MMKWPSTDCFGRQVKEGDLVLLSNDGTPFVAYLDSKNAAFVRHAKPQIRQKLGHSRRNWLFYKGLRATHLNSAYMAGRLGQSADAFCVVSGIFNPDK
ncbi:hypothetical protein NVV94_14760 [Pseudomonas sp. LS1212]|uniref:hypothetical protein n=1 Tax=Pseudomonas sp. LS1212 TaxID=2972478 RepID=UPI00215CBE17|nr:hypothetical protein [Pseudomonas sp. LS1212]UVJ41954.1 hypothetical protein NVV94_14760 [Pseudomonas sp. LS1212]